VNEPPPSVHAEARSGRGRSFAGALAPVLAPVLAIVGIAGLALGAWWLVPRAPGRGAEERPPLRVCLLDASAGVTRTRPGWASWARRALEREARAALDADEQLLVVRFATDIQRIFGPGEPRALLEQLTRGPLADRVPVEVEETRLADALAFAFRAFEAAEPSGGGRVSVLGDTTCTGRDPAPELGRLAALGVVVVHVAPPAPTRADLALERLSLPETVEPDAPLRATVELAWLSAGRDDPIALAVEIEDANGLRPLLVPLVPPDVLPGITSGGGSGDTSAETSAETSGQADGYLRWRASIALGPAAPGRTTVRVRTVLGDGRGDAIPENDEGRARTSARGALVVVVAAPPTRHAAVEAWLGPLTGVGVQLVVVEPDAVARELDAADVLVTLDVSPGSLAPRVASFVRAGGGWLACAGPRFLAGWIPGAASHVGDEVLADLLPLLPDPGRQDPRDVVFLVDGSGSMEGAPFERVRAALAELASASLPNDRIELVFFTGTLAGGVRLTSGTGHPGAGERRAALGELLAARVPGGTTAIFYSLEELAALRERVQRTGIVFLLTDGRDATVFDQVGRGRDVLERLRLARTRLLVVAVGEDADKKLLQALVAPGETLLDAGTMGDLVALFQRELHKDRRACGADLVLHADAAEPGTLAAEILAGQLGRDQFGRSQAGRRLGPELECIARAVRAPGAELLWSGPDGEPVCAVQRVGLGASAVFASAPLAGWASAWAETARLFGPLLRVLGRGARRATPPRVSVVDGRVRVERLALGSGVPGRIPARLIGPHGEHLAKLALVPDVRATFTGSEALTYTADWPVLDPSVPPGTALELDLAERGRLSLVAPRAPEFRTSRTWQGGTPAARPASTDAGHGPGPRGPWALGVGLAALFLASLLALGRVRGPI